MNLIFALQDPSNPRSLSNRMRRARSRHVVELIRKIHAEKGRCRIVDLGGAPEYWALFDQEVLASCNVHITLVNPIPMAVDSPMMSAVQGDACALAQFEDNAFDLVHSNSVVEHVGEWPRMEAFAAEVRRLSRSYYVQTPYFWFPVEPHVSKLFYHWLPEQSRVRLLMKSDIPFAARPASVTEAMWHVEECQLLDKNQFRYLFPDARHVDEQILFLTKSLMAIRD